jgi:hypothetical protein
MNNNAITARIDNTEWMYSGHGKDAGSYDCTANVAPNLVATSTGKNKCKFCHDDTVGHRNVANPFRLANNNWNGQGWNGNCFRCHQKTGAVGYQPPQDNATLTYVLKTSASFVDNNHYNPGTVNNARHTSTYNGGKFCWDCHDPHGDRSSTTVGNIVMVGKRVARATDNVLGIPVGGNDNSNRPAPVFLRRTNGIDFASTDNAAPFDGICEVCHLAASGVSHFNETVHNNHYSTNCIGCHSHDVGFKGGGGSNQEQFFDNAVRADNVANYKDMSGHRILLATSAAAMTYPTETNCLTCHGVSGTTRYANECLKCHWENRVTGGTPSHPNGIFEWATPGTPATQSAAYATGPVDTTVGDAMCLQCHGTGGTTQLNAVNPPVIVPQGEAGWNTATSSGHGATAKLSSYSNAGPADYRCAACHKSTAQQAGGTDRDNKAPGFHASMNDKLVINDNIAVHEYPSALDTDTRYDTLNERSMQMDSFCATKCHRNLTNGQAKDDNVIDHTWDNIAGQTRSGAQSHPSDFLVVPGTYYKNATLLPYSNYTSGALPGAGNVVCVTCHNPHGGGIVGTQTGTIGATIKNSGGTNLTGGAKSMLRLSPADNVSTLCKECHK